MTDALFATTQGKPLDLAMALAIRRALTYVGARIEADLLARRRGAPIAWKMLEAATVAAELMSTYGATAKAAAIAALPDGTVTECETVERTCRKLRRRKPDVGAGVVIVSPAIVARAAKRLPRKRK